jgi:hypothetical protein
VNGATPVEAKLRRYARAQIALGVFVVGGMFVVIAMLAFALSATRNAIEESERVEVANCINIEVNRNYYDSLDRALTEVIRTAPPERDLTLIRKLVDQARLARNSMISTDCQEAQG